MATNVMRILQSHGIMDKTTHYPLAIANLDGTLRKTNKAEFRRAMSEYAEFAPAFTKLMFACLQIQSFKICV